MKNQLLTLFLVTALVLGVVCISWGVYTMGRNDSEITATESVTATPSEQVQNTAEPENTHPTTQQVTAKPTDPPATQKPLHALESIKNSVSGLKVTTYYFKADRFVNDFGKAKRDVGYVDGLDTSQLIPAQGRYFVFDGYVYAEQDGAYEFWLTTDGPLLLQIGETVLLEKERGGSYNASVRLEKGYHALTAHTYGNASISESSVKRDGESYSLSEHLFDQITGNTELNNIMLTVEDNDALVCDIKLSKSGSRFTALIPPGIDLKNAVLRFDSNAKVTIGGSAVVSGQTSANIADNTAIRVRSGKKNATYTLSIRQLDTGLPCVGITSEKVISSKTEYVSSYFAICGNGASYGADLGLTACGAKVRGAYSSGLEKKPYTLKFEKKTKILDLTPEKSWILVASHLDLSQMRNYTAYEIAKEFDATDFAPRMRFVDVFVNGEYRGLYLLGDKIDISSTRFTLNQHEKGPDVGVMLELEKDFRAEGVKGYDYFQTPQGWCVTFKDPDADELTKEQRDYIRDYFIAAEQAIISGVGYEDYIDVDSFIDWFLVETLFKNCDSEFTSSIYFHKDTGGKLKMGPVWDFDSGLGNHVGFPELLDHTGWQPRNGTYFTYLMSHQSFREKMSKRWFEMHHVVEGYNGLIDSTVELIRRSYNENFKVYDILQNGIWPVPDYVSSRKSIDGQAEFMKDWVAKRIAWLDNEFSKPNYDY